MGMHMFVGENLDDDKYLTVAYQRYLKKFLRCVKGVDDNVGRLSRTSNQFSSTVASSTILGSIIRKRWIPQSLTGSCMICVVIPKK